MKIRFWILVLIASAMLLSRIVTNYQTFLGPSISGAEGYRTAVRDGFLTIDSVREKTLLAGQTPAWRAGLKAGDRILAVYDGLGQEHRLLSLSDYGDAMKAVHYENQWALLISREAEKGRWQESRVEMPPVPRLKAGRHLLLPVGVAVVLPLVTILTACFIGFTRPNDDNAFLASLLFLSFSTLVGVDYGLFPSGWREIAEALHAVLNSAILYLFMRFFLLFPSPSWLDRKMPWIKTVFLWFMIAAQGPTVFAVYAASTSFATLQRMQDALIPFKLFFVIPAGVMLLVGVASLVLNTLGAQTKDDKRKMRILLAGTAIAVLPVTALVIYDALVGVRDMAHWLLAIVVMCLAFFPLSFAYVVVKHRVFGIRVILRRGLQYALVSRGFLVVEAALLFLLVFLGLGPVLLKLLPDAGRGTVALSTVALTLALITGLREVNRRVTPKIDRRFFRDAYNSQQILTDLGRAVRRLAAQPQELLQTVADQVGDSLHPDRVAIFLRGPSQPAGSAGADRFIESLVARGARACDGYACRWHRRRSAEEAVEQEAIAVQETEFFRGDSFVARYLEKSASTEPDAVDVYLDDPKSWAHALVRYDSTLDARYQERQLLERLNTRLIVPLSTSDRVLGFISLGEKLSEEPYTREDKDLLLTVGQQVAIALDYSQLIRQVAEQEKLKREVEIAKEVQAHLFPQSMPPMNTLDYTGICRAARGVGGDYYDFIPLGHDRLGLALGDISGKGISASLLMATLQALLRSHAPLRGDSVDTLIAIVNRLMYGSTDGSKYATFFYGLYDDVRRTLTYVNAGHNPPMLFRAVGRAGGDAQHELQPATGFQFIRLGTGGMVVGLFPDAGYQQETVQLLPGDVLVVFTDGIAEAMDAAGDEFGEERLAGLIAMHAQGSPVEIRDRILGEVERFAGEAPQYDDQTLVVAKVR
ncbi:MAG: SpoIIE family protein phosphatase [Acidobacteriota bacterium]